MDAVVSSGSLIGPHRANVNRRQSTVHPFNTGRYRAAGRTAPPS